MYKRFLKDSDYLSLLTKEAFNQLVRGVEDRVWEAEEVSEASIVEYLRDKFEIEKVLRVGKAIQEYNPQITYPAGACFSIEGTIVRALKTLNGRKSPVTSAYWEEYNEPVDKMTEEEELRIGRVFGDEVVDLESAFSSPSQAPEEYKRARKYTQRDTYKPGDIVYFANKNFICINSNGPEVGLIQVPGVQAWKEVEYENWISVNPYKKNDIVLYDGSFYVLLDDGDDYDTTETPADASDDVWGLIAEYDEDETYEFNDTEWVEFEGKVFVPAMDPNATELEEGVNYAPYDPRNANIKKHMLRMAVYELHKIIAPHNISSARITDYEATLQWLQDASRLKIDPSIPRRINSEENKPVSTYASATFRRDYNPMENEWQI